ncbi:MAG: hypothetical protein PUB21_07070 [Bacteroidales bacterium]|nr:hypothetical protein [Bacteroidales bacterium]
MVQFKRWFIIIILFISGSIYAQDLIITTDNDSINCHISKIENGFISFSYINDGETENTGISENDVKSYQFAYFKEPGIVKDQILKPSHWRIVFRGGYSWMTGSIGDGPSIYKDYVRGFKHGYHVGTEIDYFFGEYFGLGGKFTFYNNKNELNLSSVGEKGKMSDNAKCLYIAPTFVTRLTDGKGKNTFLCNLSIGYFSYHNDGIIENEKVIIDGKCAGFEVGIGYERGVTKDFAIGGGLSLLAASTGKLDYSGMGKKWTSNLDERENFSRLDISLFLVFNAGMKK